MEKEITIEGKMFLLIDVQRTGAAIYRCDDFYLRLGAKEDLANDLALHEKMISYGFPVPKIISKGEYGEYMYFIEESLGEKHFGDLFSENIQNTGTISSTLFDDFLKVTKDFATAQLKTIGQSGSVDDFSNGIHLATLYEELPGEAHRIEQRFSEAMKNLAHFPFVLTHGDFNPHNLYPKGVIDLESSFWAPAGYDLITNLIHIEYFPTSKDYEYFQGYNFNQEQRKRYLNMCDELYQAQGLFSLSPYLQDFEFCRAVWLAVKMQKYPKLQGFRYNLLRKRFLNIVS